MALNIKDPVTEELAAEVAALTGDTKTGAVRASLRERRDRLRAESAEAGPMTRLERFLIEEAWPQVPDEIRDSPLTKEQREQLLGYGPAGV